MTAVVNISVLPGRIYKVTVPAGVSAYYSGFLINGVAFMAISGVNTITLESATPITGSLVLTQILRSYYSAYDGLGGTWSYQPSIDKWVTQYSFTPEWMGNVGNRLVTFLGGLPYVHNSSTYNQFYGSSYDSNVSFVHSEAGNSTKVYESVSVEGDTPDLVHVRTEVPNIQSSDLRSADFRNNEGVKYAPILRDRLSPNTAGTFDQKVYTGDMVRGEVGLFQGVFFTPSTKKIWKFVNLGFIPSRGHNTQNTQ